MNASGVYCITANSVNQLPRSNATIKIFILNNRPVIYVGISTKSLRIRDYRSRFNGNARGSTFRKSLGVLLGLDSRIEPLLIGGTTDKTGLLEEIINTGKVLYNKE